MKGKIMAKRVKLGDIVEIETSKGYAYVQYTHRIPPYGYLIRVFNGSYDEELQELELLLKKELQFSIFFPLQSALNKNIFTVVGNIEIREELKEIPLFRMMGSYDLKTKKAHWWGFWQGGEDFGRTKTLTEEQKKLDRLGTCNDTLLISRIEKGWTADQDPNI